MMDDQDSSQGAMAALSCLRTEPKVSAFQASITIATGD